MCTLLFALLIAAPLHYRCPARRLRIAAAQAGSRPLASRLAGIGSRMQVPRLWNPVLLRLTRKVLAMPWLSKPEGAGIKRGRPCHCRAGGAGASEDHRSGGSGELAAAWAAPEPQQHPQQPDGVVLSPTFSPDEIDMLLDVSSQS